MHIFDFERILQRHRVADNHKSRKFSALFFAKYGEQAHLDREALIIELCKANKNFAQVAKPPVKVKSHDSKR